MTAQVTFRIADEEDAAGLVSLYDGAARWMRSRRIAQWQPGGKDEEHFRLRMKEGEVWLAKTAGGVAVGAYELWWDDEPAWGAQPPVAGYVHRLMTDRTAAPAGLGRVVLARAEQRIAEAGRELARLDCLTSNPRLRTYYEEAGYRVVGEQPAKAGPRDGSPYGVTLLEPAVVAGRPWEDGPRVPEGVRNPGRPVCQPRVKTATVRAGTVNVPVLLSYAAFLTVASAPVAWTGCRAYAASPRPAAFCRCADGVALKTTIRSPARMVMTPGVSSLPERGKETAFCTWSAEARLKAFSVVRIFSRSSYAAEAPSMSRQPGDRAAPVSRGSA